MRRISQGTAPSPLREAPATPRPASRSDSSRVPAPVRAISTPTTRGQFAPFSPSAGSGEEDEDESFHFYRPRTNVIEDDSVFDYIPTQRSIDECAGQPPSKWIDRDLLLIKYIDDFNAVEKVYKRSPILTYSQNRPTGAVRALKSETLYQAVSGRAAELGMKVNASKTQLLCISPMGEVEQTSYIVANGEEITSGSSLKILGFYFGRRPNADEHMKSIVRKFYTRIWTIVHLMKSGLPNLDVLAMFESMVRPVMEFAAPAFHSLLTKTQAGELERLQARALKIIFGWNVSYRSALAASNTPRLEDRRKDLVLKFAKKCSKNVRFAEWFPENPDSGHNTRNPEKYRIVRGRTTRYQKNPTNYLRVILNEEIMSAKLQK